MALALALLTSCEAGMQALNATPPGATAGATAGTTADTQQDPAQPATQLATSIEHRFTRPLRDSSYDRARLRIARYALAPGKLAREGFWTGRRDGTVSLTASGTLSNGRYRFVAAEMVSMPSSVGDSRHFVALDDIDDIDDIGDIGDGDRRWRTEVDQALGTIPPPALAAAATALLRSAERPADEIRADYRRHAARVTAALGRYATLQQVQTIPRTDGSTLVDLMITLHPDALDSSYTAFSRYLRKYVSPTRFRLELRDRGTAASEVSGSTQWFALEGNRDTVRLRFRSRDGTLQPMEGPARARPDTLALHVEAFVKFGVFTVGVSRLQGTFTFQRSAGEVGWDMWFAEAPRWHLPPIAGLLVRGSLERPFEGRGVHLLLSVRRLGNGQTVLHRESQMEVQESRIMRWLGNLGFTAMNEFAGAVEQQEARFFAEAMRGWRADLAALRPPAGAR